MTECPTLLVPCAGKSTRYPGVRPKWMLTTPNGQLAVQRAVASVYGAERMRKIIAIRRDHDESFRAGEALRRAFGDAVEIVVIDHDTNGPAETAAAMIEMGSVRGPIQIKDADSFFSSGAPPGASFVSIVDLRSNLGISRVGAKSFVVINEQGLISSIIEKCVVSNHISVGLYAFADAGKYMRWLSEVRALGTKGEIFVSFVIAHALNQGEVFLPLTVSDVVDVGTLSDWNDFVAKHRLYVVDIDGVVFRNQSEFFRPYWGDPVEPIMENVAKLVELQNGGAQLVFTTSRPEKYRQATQDALEANGLRPHALVMGIFHSSRVLINDFAPSNPYPSATAINIGRNSPDLPRYLP